MWAQKDVHYVTHTTSFDRCAFTDARCFEACTCWRQRFLLQTTFFLLKIQKCDNEKFTPPPAFVVFLEEYSLSAAALPWTSSEPLVTSCRIILSTRLSAIYIPAVPMTVLRLPAASQLRSAPSCETEQRGWMAGRITCVFFLSGHPCICVRRRLPEYIHQRAGSGGGLHLRAERAHAWWRTALDRGPLGAHL